VATWPPEGPDGHMAPPKDLDGHKALEKAQMVSGLLKADMARQRAKWPHGPSKGHMDTWPFKGPGSHMSFLGAR
jgi:hypothetical protein